jgi:glutamate N-acetyltransferase/amino-acid N-acetyltransferase
MSVTAPAGFVAAGIACGIKESGDLDLALVVTDDVRAVPAAGVFTTNLAAAAPVVVSRAHLISSGGRAAAVVLSSGNANAATGAQGIADAERICAVAGGGLGVAPSEVLVCETGIIGIPLPMDAIEAGIAPLVSARAAGPEAAGCAAMAMMTTDTVRKEVVVEGPGFRVGGMAKGAAMLSPRMEPPDVLRHATMLTVLTTDARCEPPDLAAALAGAVDATFNRMTLDGCTSTNDTVLVLANGRSGVVPAPGELAVALEKACAALAAMMAADAEGATKVAKVLVCGAASASEAHRAARKVAESALVKCSLNGEDPYWGRVVSELGSAGVAFEVGRVEVAYGGTVVCRGGVAAEHDTEAVRSHLKRCSLEIACDLGMGSSSATVLTCDLGHGYIDENRTTS